MSQFTWIPAFQAIADWILEYENRQPELITLLQDIGVEAGLNDKDAAGDRVVLLQEIDPFTFYCLVIKYGLEKRAELFATLIDKIGLTVPKPTDFDGVPSAQAQKAWLFPSAEKRTPEMIQTLWQVFKAAREGTLDKELFQRALAIHNVGFAKLTECLFYAFPDRYFPIDLQTRPWLKENDIPVPEPDWEAYSRCLDTIRQRFEAPFSELSYQAWSANQQTSFSAAMAMTYLDERFPNTYSGTIHLAAYHTDSGRQLAFDPGDEPVKRKKISLFVDDIPDEAAKLGKVKEYPPGKGRNNHLVQKAPTLAEGNQAYAITVESLEQLQRVCDWYSGEAGTHTTTIPSPKKEGSQSMATPALNQILYGPPGTGKTWSTTEYAVRLADPPFFDDLGTSGLDSSEIREKLQKRYQELVDGGRIVFTTFHQSFSYEDFVEGIRAESKDESLSYDVQDGIFKSLALLADASSTAEGGLKEGIDLGGRRIWKMSLGNTLKGQDEAYEDCIEKAYIGLGWGEDIDFTGCDSRESISTRYSEKTGEQYNGMAYNVTAVNTFKNTISNGDIVIVSDGNHKFRAIGEVIGEYHYSSDPEIDYFHQQRPVRWLRVFDTSVPKEALFHKSLSQMTLYELKSKTVKLDQLRTYLSTRTTESSVPENYVLIVDEINRGNISRIFGELITLLEPDKRKGGADARKIVLPYSKLPFTVPANLYVLGTMNTADKSLAQIDLALRRRFEFVELLPDPEKLAGVFVHGVALSELLVVINQRIEVLLDRDHTIGHAYFWPIRDAQTEDERHQRLAQIFEKRVIPLLQEYFFADWERIGWVLNDEAKPYDARFIQQGRVGRPVQDLFGAEVAGQLNDRRYAINQAAYSNPAAYSGILLAGSGTET